MLQQKTNTGIVQDSSLIAQNNLNHFVFLFFLSTCPFNLNFFFFYLLIQALFDALLEWCDPSFPFPLPSHSLSSFKILPMFQIPLHTAPSRGRSLCLPLPALPRLVICSTVKALMNHDGNCIQTSFMSPALSKQTNK